MHIYFLTKPNGKPLLQAHLDCIPPVGTEIEIDDLQLVIVRNVMQFDIMDKRSEPCCLSYIKGI